jgi:hypothetical protein
MPVFSSGSFKTSLINWGIKRRSEGRRWKNEEGFEGRRMVDAEVGVERGV